MTRPRSGSAVDLTSLDALAPVTPRGRATAFIYLIGVLGIVAFGLFPDLRPLDAAGEPVSVAAMIQLLMLGVAAIVVIVGRPRVDEIPTTQIFRGGMVAAIAFFGLAWMIDTFLQAHRPAVEASLGVWVAQMPWLAALAIFAVAVLTTSQSTATRMIVPIALAAGVPLPLMVGLWVGSLGGIYLLPTNGLQIAAANFDTTGSTRLGRRLYDHSFFVPSLLVTGTTLAAGAVIGGVLSGG